MTADRIPIATPTTSLHQHNEAGKTDALVRRLRLGESIALVSDAGTPTVSDPGGVLIPAAIAAGIRVEPIPGPSSVIAALSVAGLPTGSFAFLGFPPTKTSARKEWFERMKAIGGTIVFFEAPHRILATLHELRREVGECTASLCREMTKLHEQLLRGTLTELAASVSDAARGEFTVVVEIGRTTANNPPSVPDERAITAEFCHLPNIGGVTRRKAINILAKRHGLPPNRVYEILEAAKKSG